MEIWEVCSFVSGVNVNEEQHPQVHVREFTADEELKVRWAEMVRLGKFETKKDIFQRSRPGPLLTFTLVRTVKNRELACELCLRPFRRQSGARSLCLSNSWPQNNKMLHVLAAHHGWSVRYFDVRKEFLNTPIKDLVFAVPTDKFQSRILGGVWEMTRAVFC